VLLPWLTALFPQAITRGASELVLLKVLDPLPEPVYGDLYFELHEQKQEVYIVTHIDAKAWPDGRGYIRFGFSLDKQAEYLDYQHFIADYRAAVGRYREVRRDIDRYHDQRRVREGIGLSEPLNADLQSLWDAALPESLRISESALRAEMESFTQLKPLVVGDVVKVPCLVPHSLQHGVRTIEFQTPVYERKILSFAQKVLTQDEWDTDDALAVAQNGGAADHGFELMHADSGSYLENIVEFSDFSVLRLRLQPGAAFNYCSSDYAVFIGVKGAVSCDKMLVKAEQACIMPAILDQVCMINNDQEEAILLIARPAELKCSQVI
jgi:hypothetical protein